MGRPGGSGPAPTVECPRDGTHSHSGATDGCARPAGHKSAVDRWHRDAAAPCAGPCSSTHTPRHGVGPLWQGKRGKAADVDQKGKSKATGVAQARNAHQAVAWAIVVIAFGVQGWAIPGKFTKPPEKIKSKWATQANGSWPHQQAKVPRMSWNPKASSKGAHSGQPLNKIHHTSEDAGGTVCSGGDYFYQDAAEVRLQGSHPGKVANVHSPLGNIRLERIGVG